MEDGPERRPDGEEEVWDDNYEYGDVDSVDQQNVVYVVRKRTEEIEDLVKEQQEPDEKDREPEEEEEEEALKSEEDVKDWEREAKQKIHIELEPEADRRMTIFELDSYAQSGPTVEDILKLREKDPSPRIRYSTSLGMTGIARINLSPLTQQIVGCVIGENVTTEYPWIYVKKEIIEDNIDLHSKSSDFLPMKDEIEQYPEVKMLIGYAPTMTQDEQFYICLTTDGKDTVEKHIQLQRRQHEDHVRNAIHKQARKWQDLGSGEEVDGNIIKNLRPLYEIEVVSTADLLNAPTNLLDRDAGDEGAAYIVLPEYRDPNEPDIKPMDLPIFYDEYEYEGEGFEVPMPRERIFRNVWRTLISRATQDAPLMRDNFAQTPPSIPVNTWVQYLYEYEPIDISTFSQDRLRTINRFLRRHCDMMCDQALMNSTWDIYQDDYNTLVRDERDTKAPIPIGYEEHQSYYDGNYMKERVINDLAWHPLWTGIACAAYTHRAKVEFLVGPDTSDEVARASETASLVLIWSFNDCLTPKLVLECPREVTSVGICPVDGSVIVGGCANGQIAIWNIPGMIERIESVIVRTSAQVQYTIAMKNLMRWMRETHGASVVKPSAMSSLKHSQKGPISQIVWVSPFYKVNKNGKIQSLQENATIDDVFWQCVTSSQDGTIAFWDLKWRPPPKAEIYTGKKKHKKLVKRPSPLIESISPFSALDRVFKPEYMLIVQYPGENRRVVITSLSIYNPKVRKEQVEPFPITKTDITIRRFYKPVFEKPNFVMKPEILIGTVDGEVGLITWEGIEFGTDAPTNREECRWKWFCHLHNGPVTHMVRSKYNKNHIATVGGTIFAIWREDYSKPVIWKRSTIRYTACSWGSSRPTVLLLARMDGTVEIWDFIVKSKEASFTQSVSGRIITGIHTHELYLDPQCIGFCDFNGTLRMFKEPGGLLAYNLADIAWMKDFVDEQIARKTEFEEWQRMWSETNARNFDAEKRLAAIEAEKNRLAEEALMQEMAEKSEKAKEKKTVVARKPWQFIEEARQKWQEMELTRMQGVILEKKGLRKEILEKQRAPLMKLRQDARKKKRKIGEILQARDTIFDDTVEFYFPEQRRQRGTSVSLSVAPELAGEVSMMIDVIPVQEFQKEKKIISDFLAVQEEALADLLQHPYDRPFDWKTTLQKSKARRRAIDEQLRKQEKTRSRRLNTLRSVSFGEKKAKKQEVTKHDERRSD